MSVTVWPPIDPTDAGAWTVKYEAGDLDYLRVGGSDGVYLVSQYQPPEAADVREYVPKFDGFVEAYNELAATLATVEL